MQLIHVFDAGLQYGQSATGDDKDKCQQTIYIEVSINQACMHMHPNREAIVVLINVYSSS
jgi:hypothetical protein